MCHTTSSRVSWSPWWRGSAGRHGDGGSAGRHGETVVVIMVVEEVQLRTNQTPWFPAPVAATL